MDANELRRIKSLEQFNIKKKSSFLGICRKPNCDVKYAKYTENELVKNGKCFDYINIEDIDIIKFLNGIEQDEDEDDAKRYDKNWEEERKKRARERLVFFIGPDDNLKPYCYTMTGLKNNIANITTSVFSNCIDNKFNDPIVRLEFSEFNVFVKVQELLEVIYTTQKQVFLLKPSVKYPLTQSLDVFYGGDHTSSDHCQNGSDKQVYDIYVCEGKNDDPCFPIIYANQIEKIDKKTFTEFAVTKEEYDNKMALYANGMKYINNFIRSMKYMNMYDFMIDIMSDDDYIDYEYENPSTLERLNYIEETQDVSEFIQRVSKKLLIEHPIFGPLISTIKIGGLLTVPFTILHNPVLTNLKAIRVIDNYDSEITLVDLPNLISFNIKNETFNHPIHLDNLPAIQEVYIESAVYNLPIKVNQLHSLKILQIVGDRFDQPLNVSGLKNLETLILGYGFNSVIDMTGATSLEEILVANEDYNAEVIDKKTTKRKK